MIAGMPPPYTDWRGIYRIDRSPRSISIRPGWGSLDAPISGPFRHLPGISSSIRHLREGRYVYLPDAGRPVGSGYHATHVGAIFPNRHPTFPRNLRIASHPPTPVRDITPSETTYAEDRNYRPESDGAFRSPRSPAVTLVIDNSTSHPFFYTSRK